MKVSIAVISYNRKEDVRKCLLSIRKQTRKPDEIIVVDNASTDGTHEMLRKDFKNVKLVILPGNFGLCEAANTAFANTSSEIFGIVESDMTISENWIEECVRELGSNPCTGIACPYFLHYSKHGWVDCEFKPYEDGSLIMTNAVFCVRREILENAGQKIYDTDYFLYAQEEELSARMFNLGYRIKRLETAKSFHRPGQSTRMGESLRHIHNTKNNFWNLWRFYSKRIVAVYTPLYVLKYIIEIRNPATFSKAFFRAIAGIPKCLRKRQVVDKPIYNSIVEYFKHRRDVQRTHFYFNWTTGETDDRYEEKVIA